MRRKHAVCQFADSRNRELLQRFREQIASKSAFTAEAIFNATAETPASRFWVSEERAAAVIYSLEKGEPVLDDMFPRKRAMFQEIFRRYRALRKERPDATVAELASEIVYQEAPCHYITGYRVRKLVTDERRRQSISRP